MDSGLARLVHDYQAAVRSAVQLLTQSGIPLPTTNTDWAANGIPQRGVLSGNVPYFKHGYGCRVALPSGAVDFDFGSNGETDGFDAWRLCSFAGAQLPKYGFVDKNALKQSFGRAVAAGSFTFSGYLLYSLAEAPNNSFKGMPLRGTP